jgi:hypothetical protein
MRTVVIIEVDHRKPIPALANMIAGRAYTIDGVSNAQPFKSPSLNAGHLEEAGFTLAEIRLGADELVRS